MKVLKSEKALRELERVQTSFRAATGKELKGGNRRGAFHASYGLRAATGKELKDELRSADLDYPRTVAATGKELKVFFSASTAVDRSVLAATGKELKALRRANAVETENARLRCNWERIESRSWRPSRCCARLGCGGWRSCNWERIESCRNAKTSMGPSSSAATGKELKGASGYGYGGVLGERAATGKELKVTRTRAGSKSLAASCCNWERIERHVVRQVVSEDHQRRLGCNWERIESFHPRALGLWPSCFHPRCNWERIESKRRRVFLQRRDIVLAVPAATGKELKANALNAAAPS